ncbi:hypothetical protein EDB92DRAFT_2060965 [Lactarius akahatsu]|uniref:Uncharacterized protein n=1 Tax=Lactarius akahatsu TaxID=416441 RepID=A0AAD4LMR3_9AGAM|nr:hypothetical protein EDB92DRAFT_2060965 [Lactarius akahatsu]
MGTRGYKVYRWRGWYFVYYNHCDSYPSGLGLQFLATIPKDSKSFQGWLAEMRQHFDEIIEARDKSELDEDDEDEVNTITKEVPSNDLFIEWIYTIDLDRLVFHVDSRPLFRLDHLPNDDQFLEWIGFDHYGHRAYTSSTPSEYRYCWNAPPPIVTDATLELYKSQAVAESAALSDLLAVPERMSDKEAVRVQVLQAIIGNLMRVDHIDLLVQGLAQVSDHSHLSIQERSLASYLFDIAIDPQIFSAKQTPQCESQTQWRRQNLCVHLATHLDDQRNLQAAVGGLVADAMKCPDNSRGIIYGVAFSIFHCVIVRINTQSGFTFEHSDALQFLPSFHADTPSTPGITALARLGYNSDVEVISRVAYAHAQVYQSIDLPNSLRFIKPITRTDVVMGHERGVLEPPGGGRIGQLLPQEIWEHVALELYDPIDLLMLAWFSAECKSAAERVLRYSMIGEYRLVRGLDSPNKVDNMGDEEDEYNDGAYSHLYSARFEVISNAVHAIMDLGSYEEPRRRNLEMMLPIREFDCMRPIPYTIAD